MMQTMGPLASPKPKGLLTYLLQNFPTKDLMVSLTSSNSLQLPEGRGRVLFASIYFSITQSCA